MRYLRIALFAVVMLLYWWFPYSLISGQQKILKQGVLWRFRPMPVDPYDAFRGKYITLSYNARMPYPKAFATDSTLDPYSTTFYVSLESDSAGYAYFDQLHLTPPNRSHFPTRITSQYDSTARISIPENIRRYYLPEDMAPLAEERYRTLSRQNRLQPDSAVVYLDVRVWDGKVAIEELYMEGQPIKEYLKLSLIHISEPTRPY